MALKILTWNILADCCAKQDAKGFPYVPEEYLLWAYRLPLIVKIIQQEDPDIFCLQEVDKFDDLQNAFPNHEGFYRQSSAHGLAIFARKTFKVSEIILVNYSGSSQGALGLICQTISGHLIAIFTTHLKAKEEFSNTRLEQVQHLIRNIPENIPTVICGDFNEELNGQACQLMTKNFTTAITDVITTCKKRDQLYTRQIDYIFYRNFFNRRSKTEILSVEIPDIGLPSKDHPSDHIPLIITIN